MKHEIEILAPVGSMEALYAAVENGANAVYLGGKLFNARQYASNFDNEELIEAVRYAHIRGVKVFVTVNILLDDREQENVIDYLMFLYNIDVDAVIVQDLGLIRILKKVFPDFEVHGSTQMTVNNYMGARFLEELGLERVVLARELSIEEIKFIKERTNIQLEGFIHGALCVSYSGQCLMSSMIGGRSGNRGRCAQPCRLPYSIVEINNRRVIDKKFHNKFLLSPKDLNTIEWLKEIIDSGITSLKIEGRMKRPEYVAIIVDNYRRALESIDKKGRGISQRDKLDILQVFNRGFTKGYILGDYAGKLMSIERPDNRGILVGKIVKIDNKYMYLRLDTYVKKGDGIEIERSNKENVGIIIESFSLEDGLIKIKRAKDVKVGAKVYKTLDVTLMERAKDSYTERQNKIGIYMTVNIAIDNPISLHLWDEEGNYVTVESEEMVEKAIKIALTKEKIEKQLGKLGDTPYYIKSIEINLMDNSMISVKVLNKIRRTAIEKLNDKRGNFNNRKEIIKTEMLPKVEEVLYFTRFQEKEKAQRRISVKVNCPEQFKRLDLGKLDRIYLDFHNGIKDYIDEIKRNKKEVYICSKKIMGNKDFEQLERVMGNINFSCNDGISVSDLGTLKLVKDRYNINIHCDMGLNIFNSSALKLLHEHSVVSATLSPELKIGQISELTKKAQILCETIGYGYLPLMTTKYCPLSLLKGCKSCKECNSCKFNKGYGLLDRKGMIFPMERQDSFTIIYNSQPLIVVEDLEKIYHAGVDMIRLDFTIEDIEIKDIQDIYYDYSRDVIGIEEVRKFVSQYRAKNGITKGHYFRGVK